MRHSPWRLWLVGSLAALPLLTAAACAAPPAEPAGAPSSATLPPPGYGRLRQDQFTVELRQGLLQIRITPLEEWVLRLAAPDTYSRLHSLAAQHRGAGAEGPASASAPSLFLVSFFSREAGVPFQPTDLVIESGGRVFRVAQVRGMTPGWGENFFFYDKA